MSKDIQKELDRLKQQRKKLEELQDEQKRLENQRREVKEEKQKLIPQVQEQQVDIAHESKTIGITWGEEKINPSTVLGASVLGGLIAAPFTGGLSALATLGVISLGVGAGALTGLSVEGVRIILSQISKLSGDALLRYAAENKVKFGLFCCCSGIIICGLTIAKVATYPTKILSAPVEYVTELLRDRGIIRGAALTEAMQELVKGVHTYSTELLSDFKKNEPRLTEIFDNENAPAASRAAIKYYKLALSLSDLELRIASQLENVTIAIGTSSGLISLSPDTVQIQSPSPQSRVGYYHGITGI